MERVWGFEDILFLLGYTWDVAEMALLQRRCPSCLPLLPMSGANLN